MSASNQKNKVSKIKILFNVCKTHIFRTGKHLAIVTSNQKLGTFIAFADEVSKTRNAATRVSEFFH